MTPLEHEPEDLAREPDGVPHDVIARTTFAVSVLATFTLVALIAVGWIGAVLVCGFSIPLMVFALQRRSTRERDHAHPSR